MRAGKIDLMDSISLTDAISMKKTNPEIDQIRVPAGWRTQHQSEKRSGTL